VSLVKYPLGKLKGSIKNVCYVLQNVCIKGKGKKVKAMKTYWGAEV
jgi:hypothetical protein